MDANQLPKFLPKQWVLYKLGSTFAMGKIKGAQLQGSTWLYKVTNPLTPGVFAVKESDIEGCLEGDNWTTA
jgi:hypothetical protein